MPRILAFDPGTLRCGVASLESDGSLDFKRLITLPSKMPMEDRLAFLWEQSHNDMLFCFPDYVAVEEPAMGANVKSTLAVGMAQAAIVIAARAHDVQLPIIRIHNATAKKAATGRVMPRRKTSPKRSTSCTI